MKKALAWLLVLVMLLSLTACGGNEDATPTNGNNNVQQEGDATPGNDDNTDTTEAPTQGTPASDYTAKLGKLIDVWYNGDVAALDGLTPDAFWAVYDNKSGLMYEAEYAVGAYKEEYGYTYGEGYTTSYEVTAKEEFTGDKLTKAIAAFKEQRGFEGVTAVTNLTIAVTITGSDSAVEERSIAAIEVGGDWYFAEVMDYGDGIVVIMLPETFVGG